MTDDEDDKAEVKRTTTKPTNGQEVGGMPEHKEKEEDD